MSLARPCPGAALGCSVMGSLLPRPRSAQDLGRRGLPRRGDAGRDADPVVRRAADREARHGRPPPRGSRATRSRWPTAYCGSAPPHRCTCASTGRTDEPDRVGEVVPAPAATSSSSVRCSVCLLAVPAERAAQHQRRRRPAPASRTQSHLAKENVDGLDRAAVDRRHQEARSPSARRGTSRRRNASVTIAIEAYSIRGQLQRRRPAPRRRAAGPSPGPGWRGRRRRRRAPRRRGSSPTHEAPAALGRARQVADRRAGADVERRDGAATAPAAARRRRASPRRPGRRRSAAASPAAAARISERSRSSSATSCGTAAPGRDLAACPA